MSASNSFENDILLLLFNNTNIANLGDATGVRGSSVAGSLYIALHTADPGEAGSQNTSEIGYTNYARIAVARSAAGFTVAGSAPTTVSNAAAVTFAACGVTGATATYFSIGRDSSGAGEILVSGALTAQLIINPGITPAFAIGALTATCD